MTDDPLDDFWTGCDKDDYGGGYDSECFDCLRFSIQAYGRKVAQECLDLMDECGVMIVPGGRMADAKIRARFGLKDKL